MKKLLTVLFVMFCACTIHAQDDVTTFLGIPVDGFKPEMIQKLKAKGFRPVQGTNMLEGEFNGENVHIMVGTNNNKVWRIMVSDRNARDEADIKIRFNRLVSQFENNSRYTPYYSAQSLSESEDISYEMLVNNKTYSAAFLQKPKTENGDASKKLVWFRIIRDGSEYSISMFYDNEYNQANGEDL